MLRLWLNPETWVSNVGSLVILYTQFSNLGSNLPLFTTFVQQTFLTGGTTFNNALWLLNFEKLIWTVDYGRLLSKFDHCSMPPAWLSSGGSLAILNNQFSNRLVHKHQL